MNKTQEAEAEQGQAQTKLTMAMMVNKVQPPPFLAFWVPFYDECNPVLRKTNWSPKIQIPHIKYFLRVCMAMTLYDLRLDMG